MTRAQREAIHIDFVTDDLSTGGATSHTQSAEAVATLWNLACGEELALSTRAVQQSLQPSVGAAQALCLALVNGEYAGFVTVGLLTDDPAVMPPTLGWINGLAVRPDHQQQGIGRRLVAWAERWVAARGGAHLRLGGGLRHLVPGLPAALQNRPILERLGFAPGTGDNVTWDVSANLAGYESPATVREIDGVVRPAQPGDEEALLAFFQREFPGRWRYEFQDFLAQGGRLADFMILWTARGIDGFCQLTFEDSQRPVERFFPYQLPRPWGQLGAIGISADARGKGYGAAVLDAGLRRLHNNGVNGCVIDWTDKVAFYAKFGFAPYREYLSLVHPVQHPV